MEPNLKRVLLLDTSFAARPIHDGLLEAGYETWVIGNRPSDPLAVRDPSHYLQENYSDVAATQAHIDRLGITHVVPGCTDVSIETALQLKVAGTRMDSAETHSQLGDKAKFRALCARLDLPAPRVMDPAALPPATKLIAKPVDSFSGRGITVFNSGNKANVARALDVARSESRSGQVIIETFAEGELHSYSAFVEDRKVVDASLVHEFGSVTPFAVDTSYITQDFPPEAEAALKSAIEDIALELGLVDGLVHTQFILDGTTVSIVESGRRCPGDLYPMLVEFSTGKRHAARYASYFVGHAKPIEQTQRCRHILRHTVTGSHAPFECLSMRDPVQLVEFHPLTAMGRQLPPANRIDRVGLLFAEFASHDALKSSYGMFASRSAYRTCCYTSDRS
jgi:hypothetical protein